MHVDAVNFCAMPAVVPRSAARGGSRRALLLLMLSVVTLVLFVNNLERPQTVLRWSAAPSSLQQQAVAGGSGASPSWGLLGSLDRASDPLLASPIGGADAASVSSASPPPPSAVALAAPPPPPQQQQEQPPPGKPCAAGCEARGTCNRELGRCDCPPLRGGEACEVRLLPSCTGLWGFELPIAPCHALEVEAYDFRAFPPSCECLAECNALNQRVVYVEHCVNTSGQILRPRENKSAPFPWRDPWGDGRWIQQAGVPATKRMGPGAAADIRRMNEQLAARLHRDGAESRRSGACSGRGIFTEVLPWKRAPPHTPADAKHCHCLPGWYGSKCEVGAASADAPQSKRHCVHGCSGRGVCVLNFCHCVPGAYGIDCSAGVAARPESALAVATAATMARDARSALDLGQAGWSDAMWRQPPPHTPPPSSRLRIYVYDLQPRYNIWLAAHFRRVGRWDQSYLYSLDAKLHRWLLRSPYRTLDPAQAHYFFVPAYTSLGYYDFGFGLYWLSERGHTFLRGAMDYVIHTHPYFNKSGGADHMLVMTNDKGATFIRGSVRPLQRMTLVTQWGWVRPHIHHVDTDIVVPPMLKVDKLIGESPYLGAASGPQRPVPPTARFTYLLSFVGSVRFHTPGYSMGVRQAIFRRYNSTRRFFLRDLRGDSHRGKHKQMPPKE